MKISLPAIGVAFITLTAAGQEPSTNLLRTLLHADVKQYANDGRLVATWPFRAEAQLTAFKSEPKGKVEIVANEGLVLRASGDDPAACTFREIEFLQPCKLAFEVKLAGENAGFVVSLHDQAGTGVIVNAGLNVDIFSDSDLRVDFVSRMKKAKNEGRPSYQNTVLAPGTWTPVIVDVQKTKVSLSVKGLQRATLEEALPRYTLWLVARGGNVSVRSLALDAQVDRDSMRKLVRSINAASESTPARAANPLGASAWIRIANERSEDGMSDVETKAIRALPDDAFAAVEAGLEKSHDAQPARALEAFEKALTITPKSGVVLWLAGVAAGGASALDKELKYLEAAVAADSKLASAWLALAEVHAERDADAAAVEAFRQAEALDPADPWIHASRAHFHLERSRLADARTDVDRALAKRPESKGLALLAKNLARLASKPAWKDPFVKPNEFYVVETSISSKCAADLAQSLLLYRRHLEKAFPLKKKAATRSQVWVFDSEEEYQVFSSSIGNRHENTVGLYVPLLKTLMLTSKVSAAATQHILYHEAFHQYLDLAVARAPIWMNEGLAEYFGATTFDVSGRATEGGIVTMRIPALRGPLIPVRTLMTLTPHEFMNPKHAGLHYAQSWALVHFLKTTRKPGFGKAFDAYCTAVIDGKSGAEAMKVFEDFSVPGFLEIDQELGAHVREVLTR